MKGDNMNIFNLAVMQLKREGIDTHKNGSSLLMLDRTIRIRKYLDSYIIFYKKI